MGKSLSLHTGGNWAGALPAFENLDHECAEDLNSYLYETSAVATSAVGEDPGPIVSNWAIKNLSPLGYSRRDVPYTGTSAGVYNSDLAFKDNLVIAGTYAGFRILDFTDKKNPVELVNYDGCPVGQGDVVVYGDILVRSWDSPNHSNPMCGGEAVGANFEGIHVFNIKDPTKPEYVRSLRFAGTGMPEGSVLRNQGCGSHTATAVPDPTRDALYIYNGGSSGSCEGIDIFKIKISDPKQIDIIGRASNEGIDAKTGVERVGNNSCHDNNVLLNVGGTTTSYAMCAGGNGLAMFKFDLTKPVEEEGSVEKPIQLWTQQMPGVTTGHSGSFTYDGKHLIYGHEPGGGSAARCQATSLPVERTLYFLDPLTGKTTGEMLHPRPQGSRENCTWHNFNVVPTKAGYYATVGSYQSGISVFDFSNPAAPKELAYADPPVLQTTPPTTEIILGGDWSTYWHNGTIYQSDIKRGVLSWQLNLGSDATATQANAHLKQFNTFAQSNPQTQIGSYAPDAEMPTINVRTPGEGAAYKAGTAMMADFDCADATGIESCVGTVDDGAAIDTKLGTKTFTVTATDKSGNIFTKSVAYKVNSIDVPVQVNGGTVESIMSLSLPGSVLFGPLTPGLTKTYEANVNATITSTGSDMTLSIYDAATTATGRLMNGTRALSSPLQVFLTTSGSNGATALAGGNVGGASNPTPILSYATPVANRSANLHFKQAISANNDALQAGTYGKTLTFNLSTTTP
ncbi:hypothetical protein DVA67_006100 [Solirubrobacter sp. CPCC 204708]|uniref:HYR domain-containing protein n=1 Tax=Solirubrobacter deserti TaxID=2282478 RepID=A0ABT4RCC1_9ACTN|nr:hypothetical protein [Solirubrobacter deserti]MBE2315539.1 hypothetical protein [Solirubrobacter deserti]MDA0136177.1 hypothetical protein [Solirubrobacter deserti]